jgi:dephospho-CoA kinase
MLTIGIAAGPAGGKSTVAAILAEMGATWINADKIAHQVLQEPEIVEQLIAYFGPQIVGSDGKIDRRSLSKLVFGDDDLSRQGLRYLESLIHPRTKQVIASQIVAAVKSGAQAVVLDIPLLFESGWVNQCDEVWFVDTSRDIQLAEAHRRGWTQENLNRRQSSQLDAEEKRRLSTRIIPNHGTLEDLKLQVKKRWGDCVNVSALGNPQSSVESHCQSYPLRGN